jgi:hypothetical protein
MTTANFISNWNKCCLTEYRQISKAELFNHNNGEAWGGGDITKIHLYKTISNASIGANNERSVTVEVVHFFVDGQRIRKSLSNNNVTSVYKKPPKDNPTCFTPQSKIYVS